MKNSMPAVFAALSVLLCLSVPVSSDASLPNARTFIRTVQAKGGSSGGGNGGGNLVISELFEEALVGLNILEMERKISGDEKSKIAQAIQSTRVFPVDFNLCEDDSRSDCEDSVAYMVKNYPNEKIILVDGRDLPGRWRRQAILWKRRTAVHEFAGIAGIETANHSLSIRIDDDRTLREYAERRELKRYFTLLNDLYFTLPGASEEIFAGKWKMDTLLRPLLLEYVTDPSKFLPGERIRMTIDDPRNPDASVQTESLANRLGLDPAPSGDTCTGPSLRMKNGELYCDYFRHPGLYFRKWKGRLKRAFAPSFEVKGIHSIPPFSCKILSDDRLLCRHIVEDRETIWGYFAWRDLYQYSFYTREADLSVR